MEITHWLPLLGGALLLTGAAVVGCVWWYRRKLSRLQQRFEKSRFAASQFATQAKKQIGQLQKELAERPRPNETPIKPPEDAAMALAHRKRALTASLDAASARADRLPADGFADTQPM